VTQSRPLWQLSGGLCPGVFGGQASRALEGNAEGALVGITEQKGDLLEVELLFRDVPFGQVTALRVMEFREAGPLFSKTSMHGGPCQTQLCGNGISLGAATGQEVGDCLAYVSYHAGLLRFMLLQHLLRVPDEFNAYFGTFSPAQLAGQRNVLAGDQDFECLRHVSQLNRREPRARQTHVFQVAEYRTSIIANQQANWLVDLVARVGISSVVHSKLIQVGYGACELKTVHSANELLPHGVAGLLRNGISRSTTW
jgi:hypothetical protein